jgi:hypothetical protein
MVGGEAYTQRVLAFLERHLEAEARPADAKGAAGSRL